MIDPLWRDTFLQRILKYFQCDIQHWIDAEKIRNEGYIDKIFILHRLSFSLTNKMNVAIDGYLGFVKSFFKIPLKIMLRPQCSKTVSS